MNRWWYVLTFFELVWLLAWAVICICWQVIPSAPAQARDVRRDFLYHGLNLALLAWHWRRWPALCGMYWRPHQGRQKSDRVVAMAVNLFASWAVIASDLDNLLTVILHLPIAQPYKAVILTQAISAMCLSVLTYLWILVIIVFGRAAPLDRKQTSSSLLLPLVEK